MKKYFEVFNLLVVLFFSSALMAQSSGVTNPQMNTVTIASPNVASMMKFGDYPVSLYNGLADITIPVYEIKTPSLSVPINIKYHPSGIRVTDVASWVGLGWALDAGGAVSRKIMGNDDQSIHGYLASGNDVRADLGNWKTSQTDIDYLKSVVPQAYTDGEPDVFSWQTPGKSGKFIFNQDKSTLIKIPFDKTKITADVANNLFTVIDENGVTYRFGKYLDGTNCYESSTTYNPSNATNVPANVSWLLTAIISADKTDTITFKYFYKLLPSNTDQMDMVVIKDQHQNGPDPVTQSYHFQSDFGNGTTSTIVTSTDEYKLSEIDFRNGKVVFDTSAADRLDRQNDKKLNKITVYQYDFTSRSYLPIKSVQFYQSYYNTNDRLRLDSLKMLDDQGLLPQTYKFSYNSTLLPTSLSRQRDWWGYYNSNTGTTLVPHTQISYVTDGGGSSNVWIGDASRDPDTAKTRACVLEKIYYPTGGRTEFDYETNRYTLSSTNYFGGGLRIRQIRNYDGSSSVPVVTTYKYGYNESGYGILNSASNFNGANPAFFSSSIESEYWFPPGYQASPERIRCRTYTTNLSIDLYPYDGSPIYYDYVTEYKGDPATGRTLGKTIYHYSFFSDMDNYFVPNSTNKFYAQTYYWKRGYLASKISYNSSGATVYQLANTYDVYQTADYDSVGLMVNRNYDYVTQPQGAETPNDPHINGNMGTPYLYDYNNYIVSTGNFVLYNATETFYDQNNPSNSTSKTTSYTYNTNNYLPSQVTTNLSTTEKEVTNIKYPLDYTIGSSPDAKSTAIKNLQTSNIITTPIEQYVQKMNSDGTNSRVTNAVLKSYKTTLPYLDTIYQIENTTGLTSFSASTTSGNNFIKDTTYKPKIVIDNYDTRGNTIQQSKINDVKNSYIWDAAQTYPIALVVNASSTDIAYTSFEADGSGNWGILDTTRLSEGFTGNKSFVLNSINSLTYTSASTGSNYILSYWSKDGQVTIGGATVVSTNTGLTKSGWTYYEHTITKTSSTVTLTASAVRTIDELRLYPATSKMTTYTYSPLIGITSQCSANNIVNYYNYDSFNRLRFIRDMDGNVVKSFEYNYKQ